MASKLTMIARRDVGDPAVACGGVGDPQANARVVTLSEAAVLSEAKEKRQSRAPSLRSG
jgi:hypothetical protein